MRILKRIVPYAVILAAALLLLYLPDIGPESYTDLATFFRVEMTRQGFPGYIVAAVKGGAVLYVDGFGKDGAGGRLGPDTRMLVGAAAKPFAATAAAALDAKGILDLDSPVARYLPGFAFADGSGASVRVRDLIAHASGISDKSFDDAHDTAPSLAAAVKVLATAKPVAAPGIEFHFIETGYQALGLVMEKASGREYADILDSVLFKPAGMAASDASRADSGPWLSAGSASFFGFVLPRATLVPEFGSPSSYVVADASDLGLFLAYLVSPESSKKKLMPLRQAQALLTPPIPEIPYAYGWSIREEGGSTVLESEGSQAGFSSRIALWPREKAAIAIVAPENSLLHAAISLPALSSAARRIMMEGSAARPFPVGRLYILLAVTAAVNFAGLVYQTGAARRWAKYARDKAEARGSRGPLVFATVRTCVGLAVRIAVACAVPIAFGLIIGKAATWKTVFDAEPGIAAWCASACFFGALRNFARLSWLIGRVPFPHPLASWPSRLRRST
jgi:CubicO group peptidase (beta-lactamase class C family)